MDHKEDVSTNTTEMADEPTVEYTDEDLSKLLQASDAPDETDVPDSEATADLEDMLIRFRVNDLVLDVIPPENGDVSKPPEE